MQWSQSSIFQTTKIDAAYSLNYSRKQAWMEKQYLNLLNSIYTKHFNKLCSIFSDFLYCVFGFCSPDLLLRSCITKQIE